MGESGRALQVTEPGGFEIVEVPIAEPKPDEVLIEVRACSTCTNWELSCWEGRDIFGRPGLPHYPLNPGAPGHEAAGVVVAVGTDVSRLREGDLVAVKPSTRGPENDAHATHIVRPAEEVAIVPARVRPEEAAPLEMVMCALRSVELAAEYHGGIEGRAVVVVGLGPAGILHLQAASLRSPATLIGIDPVDSRREVACRFAARVFPPDAPEMAEFLESYAEPVVFECSGSASGMSTAIRLRNSAVHVFGVPDGRWIYDQAAWLSGVAILPYHWRGRRQAEVLQQAADLLAAGHIDTSCLVSAVLAYEHYDEGLEMLRRREALKVVYRWQ